MSDDREQGNGSPSEQPVGPRDTAAEPPPPSPEELIAEDDEPRGPINLERYFTQRRPAARISVVHVITIVLMFAALLMIFTFKNRCGLMVANVFEQVSAPAKTGAPATPAPAEKRP